MTKPASDPKQKFIDTALALFAERGYFGVSLADVAKELSLTKQSVIYHFKTKDALYGAVMAGIADRLETVLDNAPDGPADPDTQLRDYLARMFAHMQAHPLDMRLVVRELLDNLERTQTGQTWYMRRFLDQSVALVAQHPQWRDQGADIQTAIAYQLIGAANYYAISGATLGAIWGEDRLDAIDRVFLQALELQLKR